MAINNSYTLTQIQFIGGSTSDLTFNVKDSSGVVVDLNGATVNWNMRQYGNFFTNSIISKSSTNPSEVLITDAVNGIFKVFLTSSDTTGLSGKFVHQPSITDFTGDTFIPSQGIIVIDKKTI